MTRIVAIALALVLAFASGATATPSRNVRGVLVRGPATVGCYPGEPCDPPGPSMLIFSRAGRVAARIRVGASGGFALHLAPGRYAIRVAPPPLVGRLVPATVRVPRVGAVRLRLAIRVN